MGLYLTGKQKAVTQKRIWYTCFHSMCHLYRHVIHKGEDFVGPAVLDTVLNSTHYRLRDLEKRHKLTYITLTG